MKARFKEVEGMTWLVMDCVELDFPDSTFDLVIDKGATDAILCGSNSFHNIYQMNQHVCRIMKNGAHFVLVTNGEADVRLHHLQRRRLHWKVEHKISDAPCEGSDPHSTYHVYVMTKVAELCEKRQPLGEEEEEDEFFATYKDFSSKLVC
eukprot:GGOE01025113.1.p1 GENE.GGOE01025113.1~~GGOE01025113.1.p1  ORF type:complete len:173 (-),score=46.05 GGOE01025113.1:330-779(-)